MKNKFNAVLFINSEVAGFLLLLLLICTFICSTSTVCRLHYLSLLANNWHMIIEFDVIKQSFEENVGNTNETVIFLRFIEWVVLAL